jgi:hypothetical protein
MVRLFLSSRRASDVHALCSRYRPQRHICRQLCRQTTTAQVRDSRFPLHFAHCAFFFFLSSRFGLVEDRDAHRLRDKNGGPVLCFKCGTSALPIGLAATAPAAKRARRSPTRVNAEIWKSIVSCDYCNLHWHLDCLDPPLPTMPPLNKKWMCPNHAEGVLVSRILTPFPPIQPHTPSFQSSASPSRRPLSRFRNPSSLTTASSKSSIPKPPQLVRSRRWQSMRF